MKNIFYKPGDGWVGDTIPFAHDGKFYIFYLHDELESFNHRGRSKYKGL